MKARRLPQEGIVVEVIENLQEIIWDQIGKAVRRFVKGLIEKALKEELTDQIGAEHYERNQNRKGYRNGSYRRSLLSRFGLIEDIQVPRMNEGGIQFSVFDRYEQRRRDVDAAIGRLFVNGVSTRKLRGIAEQLYGKSVSAQTVSNTFAQLDKEVERFKDKPIADTVEFLFLDGMSKTKTGRSALSEK